MAATVQCFEIREGRDDLALLEVVKQLPEALRAGVCNPVQKTESLTNRLGTEGVEDACNKLEMLASHLEAAVHASEPSQACIWMQAMFGGRFPMRPENIQEVTVADTVRAATAAVVASPLVGRSKAG